MRVGLFQDIGIVLETLLHSYKLILPLNMCKLCSSCEASVYLMIKPYSMWCWVVYWEFGPMYLLCGNTISNDM